MGKLKDLKELERYREQVRGRCSAAKKIISVCTDANCMAFGAEDLISNLRKELHGRGIRSDVDTEAEEKAPKSGEVFRVIAAGCMGFCERGILVNIKPDDVFYQQVKPKDAAEIVEQTLLNGKIVERLLFKDPASGKRCVKMEDVPFYKHQMQLVLGNNKLVNPERIDDYIAVGGYSALAKALLTMKPEQIINEVIEANVRGRGGGGFDAGWKWKSCREAHGEPKYVLCNGDEGDPGAFMDRAVMEGNPHCVIEGMIIGSYAIGSSEGYIFVRDEYPLAVRNLGIAIRQAEEKGLLGDDILGSGHSFRIRINRGGGAFVCGESTALMNCIEGKIGEPRAKHIHTVESGLWDKPTNLNNVETWANVPLVINNGAKWYRSIGTEGSKGTKIFALVGKVNNTGLVEVPMGITMKDVVFKIGGGIKDGKKFKGVQTGGPSGGVIPERFLDSPVDFDELTKLGSMMGSGGMIVMDDETCMVDVARYFLGFLKFESCGKCTSCREGLVQLYEILQRISQGKGRMSDLRLIEDLSEVLTEVSLCALGGSAANPVLTTLKYFRDEYAAHIEKKECPAKVCTDLIWFEIDPEKCTGCTLCAKRCPTAAITGELKKLHAIDQAKCIKCRVCREVCPKKWAAVEIKTGVRPAAEVANA